MFQTLFLGKLSGIRIYIHWTFWWLIVYFVLSQIGNGIGPTLAFIGFVFAVFGCVFLHELGHAFAGRWFGVQTQDITLMPIGGLARMGIPKTPLAELVIAACGPLVNVVIATIIALGFAMKATISGPLDIGNMGFVEHLLVVNVGLVIFNLLPVYPMDGGRIVRALLQFVVTRDKAVHWTARLGQALAGILVIYGLFYSWQMAFIFAIMFVVCSVEIFQAKMRKAFREGQFPGQGPASNGPYYHPHAGPYGGFGHAPGDDRSGDAPGDIIDAEEVRRVQ